MGYWLYRLIGKMWRGICILWGCCVFVNFVPSSVFEWRHCLSLIILLFMSGALIDFQLHAAYPGDVNLEYFMLTFGPYLSTTMPVGPRKQAFAQAVTSWNEQMTYKGLSLHQRRGRGSSRTKIHQGAECHYLTRWAAVRWERPSWALACQRIF